MSLSASDQPVSANTSVEAAASGRYRLDALLRPRSVAVIGASANRQSWGGAAIENLRRLGFPGTIYPVNPNYTELDGLRCYSEVTQIEGPVDVALLFVPKKALPTVLDQCGRKGVSGAIILAAGFSEAGGDGAAEEGVLRDLAQRHGIAICGPNCMGLVNLADGFMGYTAATLPTEMVPGPTALISQSGQLAAVMFVRCHDQGVFLRYLVSAGNELNVEATDYARWALDDAEVKCVGMILEGLRDPARFLGMAAHARAAGKPLIVLKLGRSKAAARTALSHTGKLAGSARAYDAVFRQNNVISVDDPLEIADVASLFAKCPAPPGRRVAFVTFSGGWCGTVADQAEGMGIELADFAKETVARLRPILDFTPPVNPVDLSGQVNSYPERWTLCLDAVHDDPNTDIVVVFVHQVRAAWRDRYLEPTLDLARRARKPVIVVHDGGKVVEAAYEKIVHDGAAPVFRATQPMLKALRRFLDYYHRVDTQSEPLPTTPAGDGDAQAQLRACILPWDRTVPEHAAKAGLRAYDLPMTPEAVVASSEAAKAQARTFGFPVALKGVAAGIEHKTEAGLVKLRLRDDSAVESAYRDLSERLTSLAPGDKKAEILLQPMAPSGVEVLLGLHRDPDFGPMILLGLGGTAAELLDDVSMRRAPLSPHDVREMIEETRLGEILSGFRGAPPADREALVRAVLALSAVARDFADDIESIDINPLIVLPKGEGCVAVDALIVKREA